MLYIIINDKYKQDVQKTITNYIQQHYFKVDIKIQETGQIYESQHHTNLYFIVNKHGLDIAQYIRNHDQGGHIVLVTENIDYTQLFRSHIRFLGVIDSNHDVQAEIEDYIDFAMKNQMF